MRMFRSEAALSAAVIGLFTLATGTANAGLIDTKPKVAKKSSHDGPLEHLLKPDHLSKDASKHHEFGKALIVVKAVVEHFSKDKSKHDDDDDHGKDHDGKGHSGKSDHDSPECFWKRPDCDDLCRKEDCKPHHGHPGHGGGHDPGDCSGGEEPPTQPPVMVGTPEPGTITLVLIGLSPLGYRAIRKRFANAQA
jgi:hypothetical protein